MGTFSELTAAHEANRWLEALSAAAEATGEIQAFAAAHILPNYVACMSEAFQKVDLRLVRHFQPKTKMCKSSPSGVCFPTIVEMGLCCEYCGQDADDDGPPVTFKLPTE